MPASPASAAPSAAPADVGRTPRHSALGTALIIAGAQCSFFIGAAFATGQESMQYFTSHGWAGIVTVLAMTALFAWTMTSLTEWGRARHGQRAEPFTGICGPLIGWVLRLLSPLFLFLISVMMVAGAGATMSDAFGWPDWGGKVLLAAMLLLTLSMGFVGLVEVIGRLGPILVLLVAVVSAWILIRNWGELGNAAENLEKYQPAAAIDNPWVSMLMYSIAMLVIAVPFLAALGSNGEVPSRSTIPGGLFGALIFGVAMGVTALALLAALPLIHDSGAPMLVLGSDLNPTLGVAFALVAFLGIYSTAAPMLWTIADQMPGRESRLVHRLTGVALAVLALICGLVLDFSTLVGAIYPKVGYVGLLFFGILLVRQIISRSYSLAPRH